ncbi:MAG: hypothetical protein APR54_12705 [Candidatus Cloacimonas sp. SDB]|nr:MAG: hypothetical protein APR54_12705 [Candidatus Cloacimonas sp. SDB]
MNQSLSKILIIVVLIIVVAVVILLKNQPAENEKVTVESSGEETVTDPLARTKDLILSEKEEEKQPKTESEEQTETVKEEPEKTIQYQTQTASGDVLAIVAGKEITEKELESEYEKLSSQYKDMFKNDKDLYLEQLIIKQLLVQQASEKGYIPADNSSQAQEDTGIQQLIAELGSNIDVPEAEIEEFYQENQSQMQGAGYEQVKNDIRNYLVQQKQGELIEEYIDEIRQSADVVLNEDWIARQLAGKPINPLSEALQNGLPTVLDLGSDTCIPCQMMMPIFAELENELAGKANILLLQIDDYRDLANKYKVRVIPTQIFFDQNGQQYWRHEGFLAKEDIIKKLKETGAEL